MEQHQIAQQNRIEILKRPEAQTLLQRKLKIN